MENLRLPLDSVLGERMFWAALEQRIEPVCPDQWCQLNLSEADEDLSVA